MLDYITELNCKWNGRSICIKEEQEVLQEIEETHKRGYSYVVLGDENYPKVLENFYEISPIFMVKGEVGFLSQPIVGIVGTRIASANGISFTKQMARSVVNNDFVVCSGGAVGIDTAAHLGAMPRTICVLPGGPDNLYPQENIGLFDDISQTGLLVTDVPVGSSITKASFLRRNKIIAALSNVLCVMESGENSGALFTAKVAMAYGKRVLSVPGHPTDSRYEGNNDLIRNHNAALLLSVDDITNAYFTKTKAFNEDRHVTSVSATLIHRVYDMLNFTPIHINDLCSAMNLSISEVMCAVGELLVVDRVVLENMMVCRSI